MQQAWAKDFRVLASRGLVARTPERILLKVWALVRAVS
jgi:hypothetical protein